VRRAPHQPRKCYNPNRQTNPGNIFFCSHKLSASYSATAKSMSGV
jgi:hypothetical protein